ncbi:MAG: type II CAAX endopeptidase family protein [Candidatus Daviesbacteria bacterium]|nr:type II CAAX endopeptidase family protein [Candidatus Daviesbacteria bacterium]
MSFKNSHFRWIFLYLLTFILWAIYRFFEQFPTWVDEMIFKPVLKFAPIIYTVFILEKKGWVSLGFSQKNLWTNIFLGIGLGLALIIIRIIAKDFVSGDLTINPLNLTYAGFVVAAVTATVVGFLEETIFRGYFFQRIYLSGQSEASANIISSMLSAIAHLPLSVFLLQFSGNLSFYFTQALLMSMLFAFVFARRKSIFVSITAHAIWNFSNYLVV